jgi:hypothetical protein
VAGIEDSSSITSSVRGGVSGAAQELVPKRHSSSTQLIKKLSNSLQHDRVLINALVVLLLFEI